jgi:HKD family nuclease
MLSGRRATLKLINNPKIISNTFTRLLAEYDHVSFAVAWASTGFTGFSALSTNHRKIRRGVIGTHFHQTHPDFIRAFQKHASVRFILEADELFHPKVFLFENKNGRWACMLGSANFTSGGFGSNHELCALFDQSDVGATSARKRCDELFGDYWELGRSITNAELENYQKTWEKYRRYLKKASGRFGGDRVHKAVEDVELLMLSWKAFVAAIRKSEHHSVEVRSRILGTARALFSAHQSFADIPDQGRGGIAGFVETEGLPWKWFGSMQGAGHFKGKVNENSVSLAAAIDRIPLTGHISRNDYFEYVELFRSVFADGDRELGHGLGTATRLLAMKRPDYFVCFDKANAKGLCKAFGIPSIPHRAYERYWDDIIERILDSVWWNSARPSGKLGGKIWDGRTAFLDAIYYDPNFKK